MNTLYLTPGGWDLTIDASGNIAMATDPYSIAQDVASACRAFLGECWYDTTIGVPYLQQILGIPNVSLSYIKGQLVKAALTVPEVSNAVVVITSFKGRALAGQIQITTTSGQSVTVGL